MFYQLEDEITSIEYNNINDHSVALGLINLSELDTIYKQFNLPLQAVEMCKKGISEISAGVEIYDQCCFIKLHFASSIGIFILKNIMIVVSIQDKKCFVRDTFMKMLSRICCDNISVERCILILFDTMITDDNAKLEELWNNITNLEESVINNTADDSFNIKLLDMKKVILSYRSYYERLIDILEVLEENDNDIFDENKKHFKNFAERLNRLKDNTDMLTDSIVHLWDAYQAAINMNLNNTMKIFTLVTTIFFPLTVVVGWYGMNFNTMPELNWRYGYIYVIVLSAAVITALILWFKKRKWI
ncbi:MAG: hypothetical protein NC397_05155 [Clostridium sp.]|nr:hypothetical protein [Clostridium sp.]